MAIDSSMMQKLTKARVFLIALLTGGAAFGALQMNWAKVSASSITGYTTELDLTGAAAQPAGGILIGAFLAAACVFAISGKKLALTSSVVMLLSSVFRIQAVAALLLNPQGQLATAVATQTGVAGDEISPVVSVNVYFALVLSIAMLLVAALALFIGLKQPVKSDTQKYQRAEAQKFGSRKIVLDDPIDQWDALSRGEDPS